LPGPATAAVLLIDRVLRRRYGIREFTDAPGCVLRISLARAKDEVRLSDGTRVRTGDPVGEIHLWNERIPKMSSYGPDMAWALGFQRLIVKSLGFLADYVRSAAEFENVEAFRARLAVKGPDGQATVSRLAGRLGFEALPGPQARNLRGRLYRFFDNLYATWLILVFNPVSLKGKGFWQFERPEIWISRRALLERYGTGNAKNLAATRNRI